MRGFLTFVVFATAVLLLATAQHHFIDRPHDAKIAKAAYEKGKQVGRNLGACETLRVVIDTGRYPAWVASAQTQATIVTCRAYEKAHAPGTIETVKVP